MSRIGRLYVLHYVTLCQNVPYMVLVWFCYQIKNLFTKNILYRNKPMVLCFSSSMQLWSTNCQEFNVLGPNSTSFPHLCDLWHKPFLSIWKMTKWNKPKFFFIYLLVPPDKNLSNLLGRCPSPTKLINLHHPFSQKLFPSTWPLAKNRQIYKDPPTNTFFMHPLK